MSGTKQRRKAALEEVARMRTGLINGLENRKTCAWAISEYSFTPPSRLRPFSDPTFHTFNLRRNMLR